MSVAVAECRTLDPCKTEVNGQLRRSGTKGDHYHPMRLVRGGENTYALLFPPELTCEVIGSKQGGTLHETTSVLNQFDRSSQVVIRCRLSLGIRQETCDQT